MNGFMFREMILAGWPVLVVLLIMSVVSLTIILDRVTVYRRARLDARAFVDSLLGVIRAHGLEKAVEQCHRLHKPIAEVAARALLQPGGREAKERAAEHILQAQITELSSYVAVLGTIGSTAPFVGLFGTVMGIIKSFQDIGMHAGAGPEVVSIGIAEALITTAFGLLVAIPAVMFYNYCAHQVQKFAQEIDLAAFELIDSLTPPER